MTSLRRGLCCLLGLMVAFPQWGVAKESINLIEGYWNTFATIRVHGGIFPVPAIKSSKCITQGDPVPNSSSQSSGRCRVFDKNIAGNQVSWRIECVDAKGRTDGQGKITYAGKTFDGAMDITVQESGGGRHLSMEYVMHGERVGVCDGTSEP